jgi:transposase-like protein
MPKHAKSEMQKRQDHRRQVAATLQAAVKTFHERASNEQPSPDSTNTQNTSIRAIAREFGVDHVTLSRYVQANHRTIDEFNASKTKLSAQQEEVLVSWLVEMADRNLALSPEAVCDRALEILRATDPNGEIGVGWFDRFMARHNDRLHRSWSRPMD